MAAVLRDTFEKSRSRNTATRDGLIVFCLFLLRRGKLRSKQRRATTVGSLRIQPLKTLISRQNFLSESSQVIPFL